MTNPTIEIRPPVPIHALEIWCAASGVAARFESATGFAFPRRGRSGGSDALRLIRYEPTVWLVEGDVAPIAGILFDDGALTAIGGGIVTIRLSGTGWRALLMENGVFDAESAAFAPGCSASTVIDHVAVRLHVVSADVCDAYVPTSLSRHLAHFWRESAKTLVS